MFKSEFTDGVVVWARLGSFPWWPARIVNRNLREPGLHPTDALRRASKANRMVEFFNYAQRIAVIDLRNMVEFTANMAKARDSDGDPDVIRVACDEAEDFIREHGCKQQKALLRESSSKAMAKRASRRRKSALGFAPGVVVWARLGIYPWWPAVIVKRSSMNVTLEPGDSFPPASEKNRMVMFFNDHERVSVVDVQNLLEFTKHMKKLDNTGDDYDRVTVACGEAQAYIKQKGCHEQKQMLRKNPYDVPKPNSQRQHGAGLDLTNGTVAWARVGTFPWWPCLVVDRNSIAVALEPGFTFPRATVQNRMVQFFNDDMRVDVVGVNNLVEFTTNLHKRDEAGDSHDAVLVAYREAVSYIQEDGSTAQKASLEANNLADVHPETNASNTAWTTANSEFSNQRRSMQVLIEDETQPSIVVEKNENGTKSKKRRRSKLHDADAEEATLEKGVAEESNESRRKVKRESGAIQDDTETVVRSDPETNLQSSDSGDGSNETHFVFKGTEYATADEDHIGCALEQADTSFDLCTESDPYVENDLNTIVNELDGFCDDWTQEYLLWKEAEKRLRIQRIALVQKVADLEDRIVSVGTVHQAKVTNKLYETATKLAPHSDELSAEVNKIVLKWREGPPSGGRFSDPVSNVADEELHVKHEPGLIPLEEEGVEVHHERQTGGHEGVGCEKDDSEPCMKAQAFSPSTSLKRKDITKLKALSVLSGAISIFCNVHPANTEAADGREKILDEEVSLHVELNGVHRQRLAVDQKLHLSDLLLLEQLNRG